MFCASCGSEQNIQAKFCVNCGKSVPGGIGIFKNQTDESPISGAMSISEYMAHTNIKSREEAQKYLTNLKILFWLVGVLMFAVKGGSGSFDEGTFALILLVYLVLLVYFVIYCVKVVRAEKICRSSAVFTILFAPISWIWFYPAITEPLKIILGIKPTPVILQLKNNAL